MAGLDKQNLAEEIAEEAPPNEGKREVSIMTAKPSPKLPNDDLSTMRLKWGYQLARIIVVGIFGAYAVGVIAILIQGPGELSLGNFTLEVIRLVVPPLTFVLGFIFGAKQQI